VLAVLGGGGTEGRVLVGADERGDDVDVVGVEHRFPPARRLPDPDSSDEVVGAVEVVVDDRDQFRFGMGGDGRGEGERQVPVVEANDGDPNRGGGGRHGRSDAWHAVAVAFVREV
jgi:hypothetical protein